MRIPPRFKLFAAVLVVVLSAGAALADVSTIPPPDPGSTCDVPPDDVATDEGVAVEEGDEGQEGEEGNVGGEGEAEESDAHNEACVVEDPAENGGVENGGVEDGTEGGSVDPVVEDRQADCEAAAGVSPVGPDPGTVTEDVKLTGLDNAIERVLANCVKNPQAPGLLNALEHLIANRDRHQAKEAEKALRAAERAERKAAREAWKAAKKAAREAGGHGTGQDHGSGN